MLLGTGCGFSNADLHCDLVICYAARNGYRGALRAIETAQGIETGRMELGGRLCLGEGVDERGEAF